MKEDLIKDVLRKANLEYADDFPIQKIEQWIKEFFDHLDANAGRTTEWKLNGEVLRE